MIVAGSSYCFLSQPFHHQPETYNYQENHPEQTSYTQEAIEMIASNMHKHMYLEFLAKHTVSASCIAIDGLNISVCENMEKSESKMDCIDSYNYYLLIKSRCDLLDGGWKNLCESVNGDLCDNLIGEDKDICESILKNNVSICVAGTSWDKLNCEKHVYTYWAVKNEDVSECSKITDFYSRAWCKAIVEGSCVNFVDTITKDWVYFELSRDLYNTTDTSICGGIFYPEIRVVCLDHSISYLQALLSI